VAASRALIERCGFNAVLASLGAEGSVLVSVDGAVHVQRTEVREVFDVSGAGDTVVATVAAALAAGADVTDAARLANAAAGIVVGKIGTAVVYASELGALLNGRDLRSADKGGPRSHAPDLVARWRRPRPKIRFT